MSRVGVRDPLLDIAMRLEEIALGRLPGWIAQWREMMADPATKIGRPRQVYIGPVHRSYVPVDDR
jgi:citrate synthase